MTTTHPPRNLGLDLVRATEAAALAAGRWAGLGQPDEAEQAAAKAMSAVLAHVEFDGRLCLGEEARLGDHATFATGQRLGTGRGPAADVLADGYWPAAIPARYRSSPWPPGDRSGSRPPRVTWSTSW